MMSRIFSLIYTLIYLFIHLEKLQREIKTEKISIHWFSPQVTVVGGLCQIKAGS